MPYGRNLQITSLKMAKVKFRCIQFFLNDRNITAVDQLVINCRQGQLQIGKVNAFTFYSFGS